MIFQTKRLTVRKAEITDIDFYLLLWNDGKIMYKVGFPSGLGISRDKVKKQIEEYDESEFNRTLVVIKKDSGKAIGECKLGFPNKKNISTTDIKLLPEFWGHGFGKEIKNGLCKYLFSKTNCKIVEASPNINNIASQKMQKALGGKEIKRGIYHFPPKMQHFTKDVHCIIYHICKYDWLQAILKIVTIDDPQEKSEICLKVLQALPEWFGIEESTQEYIAGVAKIDFLAAFMNGEVVGFYSIISHFPQTSEIYVCGVLPEYHRLGIGCELQKAVEEKLKSGNVHYLTVKTLSYSHPDKGYAKTREFYLAQDFIPLEEFTELWGKENPCLFLVKKLL